MEGAEQFISSTGLKSHAMYSSFKWLSKCANFDLNDVKLVIFLKNYKNRPAVRDLTPKTPMVSGD